MYVERLHQAQAKLFALQGQTEKLIVEWDLWHLHGDIYDKRATLHEYGFVFHLPMSRGKVVNAVFMRVDGIVDLYDHRTAMFISASQGLASPKEAIVLFHQHIHDSDVRAELRGISIMKGINFDSSRSGLSRGDARRFNFDLNKDICRLFHTATATVHCRMVADTEAYLSGINAAKYQAE